MFFLLPKFTKLINFGFHSLFIMKYLLLLVGFLYCLQGCKSSEENPSTALDTGTSFIRASLDGDFTKAKKLLLQDTANIQLFSSYEAYYQKLPEEKKKKYKAASYNINKFTELNDSTSVINYSNSYMNEPLEIKLVYVNEQWQVDFKFTSASKK